MVSFRHEKFVPRGGPDGGDGGGGGDVVLVADASVAHLRMYHRGGFHRAGDGKNGQGQKKHGKRGQNRILAVPAGTVVVDKTQVGDDVFLADLAKLGQRVTVARGGRGGWGNVHFTSSVEQAPRIAQRGETGEERAIVLELKLLADVGIIGYPNVGKSTLVRAASAARPKVASYPFTTLEPVLALVEVGQRSFVMAEIPGLIDDAHLGRGLGHDFLRHITRTRILIHIIDGGSATPVEDLMRVNAQLALFDSALVQKPQIVAVNKVDLPEVADRRQEIRAAFDDLNTGVQFLSAATGEGVAGLMGEADRLLAGLAVGARVTKETAAKVFRPRPRDSGFTLQRKGDVFVVAAGGLERLMVGGGGTASELKWQLKKQFARMGIDRALKKAGVKTGGRVRCGSLEWEWQ